MAQASNPAGEDAPNPALSQAMALRKQRIGLSFVAYLASSGVVNRDPLTGLFSRPQLIETLSREIDRQARAKGVFSLALLDIDQFRQINRQHGYEAGDAVLRAIATAFGGRLRAMDVLGRYGEEAFMLIMPKTPLEGALVKAGRMQEQIAQLAEKDLAAKGRDAKPIEVRTSIGVTTFCQGDTIELVLARAEGANRIASLPLVDEPALQEA
ncbi:GGDEF domain-containing protein [Aquabacterium sp. NJ1]|uniref:GGDEF domain-containing protein n=1 Tax=Aquabacterium sp. NJ1 TaxID=1538295 RepID=UPI00068CD4EF|nr:GGDEF domain-containing protein [Aquabacterium sp. NJ1]